MSAGKGDTYRPVDRDKYERNYLRIFGVRCPHCEGAGCEKCNHIGFVERK